MLAQHRTGHPRLYFTADELAELRRRPGGLRPAIWANMSAGAEACLAVPLRGEWIAPLDPDPVYENLYDRFWAMMSDAAVLEHLALTAAYGNDERIVAPARDRLRAACEVWTRETEPRPDYGSAYAVTRLVKAIAVGYDALYPWLNAAELSDVHATLVRYCTWLYAGWFTRPEIAGPVGMAPGLHSPHHSTVEWASFGVAALAMLGECAEATTWVRATVRQFEDHLLPDGLSADGAAPEGDQFWASTMQSRLWFMDPLRRVTGTDLFAGRDREMGGDFAAATAWVGQPGGRPYPDDPVGHVSSYAPVLPALAREYRRPHYQYLASWDSGLGNLDEAVMATPRRRERMRSATGCYAYGWYDPSVPARVEEARQGFHFPSLDEAFLRDGWSRTGMVVAIRRGRLVVHAGGQLVLADLTPAERVDVQRSREAGTGIIDLDPPGLDLRVTAVTDDGTSATVECGNAAGTALLRVVLDRERHRLLVERRDGQRRRWWSHPGAVQLDADLPAWCWSAGGETTTVRLRRGGLECWQPRGHRPDRRVGYGLLDVPCDSDLAYPLTAVTPDGDGRVTIEVTAT